MKIKRFGLQIALLGCGSLFTMAAFQNCEPGFQSAQLSSLSSGNAILSTPELAFTNAQEIFNTSDVTIEFTALAAETDSFTSIKCQLNSEPTQDCSLRSITLKNIADGDHILDVVAITKSGQRAEVKRIFRKDSTMPTLAVSSQPSSVTNAITAQFTFTAADNLSGIENIECSLDDVTFAACESPVTRSALAAGSHSFRVRATDRARNVSSLYSYSWMIDLTSPTVNFTQTPSPNTNQANASFSFSGAGVVSYQCSLDNSAFSTCTSPKAYSALAAGAHKFAVKGTNAASTASLPAAYSWLVDTIAPTAPVITSTVSALTNSKNAGFNFASTDALSGIASYDCSLDSSAYATCTSSRMISNLGDGSHSFRVRSVDNAQNPSAESSFNWTVDTVGPALALTETPTTGTTSLTATLAFTATDANPASFQCSLDGTAFSTCSSPMTYTNLSVSTHTFKVQAQDGAGNSSMISYTWTIAQSGGTGESTGSLISATFAAGGVSSTSMLPNPDRGVALWAGNDFVTNFDIGSVNSAYRDGARIVYCTLDLAAHKGKSLPASFLATLQTNFDVVRNAGMKCMMLVAYNVYGGSNADGSLTDIQTHAAQLAPYLKKNADVIPMAKMGFVGVYGQWFGSTNNLTCGYGTNISCPNATVTENQLLVRDAILGAYSAATSLGFTNAVIPYQWSRGTPISSSTAFTGTARVGIENDCPLTGSGTPLVSQQDSGVFTDSINIGVSTQQLIDYTKSTTEWSSYFGEISKSCTPQTIDCASATKYFSGLHANSFKMLDSDPWINSWKAGGCYNTLMNGMGYSLHLDGVNHQSTATRGQSITLKVQLRNQGYSRIWTPRKLIAQACLLTSPNTCYTGTYTNDAGPYPGTSDGDLRQLPPQAISSTTMTTRIAIPVGATPGVYQIRLSVPDVWATTQARSFMIRFDNSNSGSQTWNDVSGYMTTGTSLTVN